MGLRDTWDLLIHHPLNRDHKLNAIARYLRWQVGSLVAPGPVAFRFVNDALLLAHFGMTAATGNVYAGLYEFEDMAFVAHVLRPGELFVDVGANIGSYTILAAAVGARCLSLEPVPATFAHLQRNVNLNAMGGQVDARNLAAGAEDATLRFTADLGAMNRVATDGEATALSVPVRPLDALVGDARPRVIKIDVEGFETNVIRGARRLLARPELLAVLMEQNGNGVRYGFDEQALHAEVRAFGFSPARYEPLSRRLLPPGGDAAYSGNVLYIRNLDEAQRLLTDAPPLTVHGRQL
jgi:FkbM family methyltransferase